MRLYGGKPDSVAQRLYRAQSCSPAINRRAEVESVITRLFSEFSLAPRFVWGWISSTRGGSWINDQQNARCANRNRNVQDNFNNNVGFRVLLSIVFVLGQCPRRQIPTCTQAGRSAIVPLSGVTKTSLIQPRSRPSGIKTAGQILPGHASGPPSAPCRQPGTARRDM